MTAQPYAGIPYPIAFSRVQVGDTIRAEKTTRVVRVVQGEVTEISIGGGVCLSDGEGGNWWCWPVDGWSLTLIDCPEPERPVGSLWYDPNTGTGYVRTDTQPYIAYLGFSGPSLFSTAKPDSPLAKRFIPWADRPDASEGAS